MVKARATAQKNTCINNLKQIDGAKEQWAIETKKSAGSATDNAAVNAYIKGGAPTCPARAAIPITLWILRQCVPSPVTPSRN